ncbi:hypothetical protein AB1L30_01805 [Bremerella sp. JC817]|uniref:hypothetical protein n=1 Tax=Bremerella sp. JC817 TaxID=3231756 RepID=UPI003457A4A5
MMNPTQNQLPDLRKINQRLALNSVRVQAFLNGLAPRMDALVAAAREGNLAEIGRVSHFIHRCCDVYGYEELASRAADVCEAAAACEPILEVDRKIVRLVGAFARTNEKMAVASQV